jgi:hypothetical protein
MLDLDSETLIYTVERRTGYLAMQPQKIPGFYQGPSLIAGSLEALMFYPFCLPLCTLCVKHLEKSPSETWRAPTEFQKGHESGDGGH